MMSETSLADWIVDSGNSIFPVRWKRAFDGRDDGDVDFMTWGRV
jgi:hypothetical protein